MKNWMKFAAALVIGAFVFTACEDDEVILSVPSDTELNLGAEFNPMDGVAVDGADIEDVSWNAVPAWNIYEVNHYVFTYTVENQVADRNVYITSDLLAGTYDVVDLEEDATTPITYSTTVLQHLEDYNKLLIQGFAGFSGVTATATVAGSEIIIPEFRPANWVEGEGISATGTYDGENRALVSFDIIIKELVGEEVVTTYSQATYTKVAN